MAFGNDFNAAYKHVFNKRKVQNLVYGDASRPLLSRLKKIGDFYGESYYHSVFFEDPQGDSANFEVAIQNKAASSRGARFIINRGRRYQAISISNEEIAASENDEGALLKKKATETRGVINNLANRIEADLHGSASGVLASFTTGGSVATTVVTLDTPAMGIRFAVGMSVQVSSTNPTDGSLPTFIGGGGSAKISSVSRGAAATTLVLDANLSAAFPGIATTTQYYLVKKGDAVGFSATNASGGVSGLKAWLPLIAPTSGDNFWGYDRSTDASRLSGIRYTAAAGESYEQTFMQASSEAFIQGTNNMVVLAHPNDVTKFKIELGNRVRYVNPKPREEVAVSVGGIVVDGAAGEMELLADPHVDPGVFYALDLDTWYIKHLGDIPHLDESDGAMAKRENQADAIEMRWRAWFQLICDAPGRNLVGTFSA